MSQLSFDVATQPKQDALLRLISRLPDPEDRESYAALVSYIHSLPPGDEFTQVAQLFGFLTLMGRELPEHLEEQRQQLRKLLLDAHAEFKRQVQTNARYHDQLAERLDRLPEEIAAEVKPAEIAKTMAEAFRQQIAGDWNRGNKSAARGGDRDLKQSAQALGNAVEPVTSRYNGIAGEIEQEAARIGSESRKLANTAAMLQRKNAELVKENRKLEWYWLVAIVLIVFAARAFTGANWEQRNSGDTVQDLQRQLTQLVRR